MYQRFLFRTKSPFRRAGQCIAWGTTQLSSVEVGGNRDIHVRNFIPGRRIEINSCAIVVDPARTMLPKQPEHAGSSGLLQFPKHCKID